VPLNIKNAEVERLVEEVAQVTGESKTEAVRVSLQERQARLVFRQAGDDRAARLRRLLEDEIWPSIPSDVLGTRLTRKQEDEILGYGKNGV